MEGEGKGLLIRGGRREVKGGRGKGRVPPVIPVITVSPPDLGVLE